MVTTTSMFGTRTIIFITVAVVLQDKIPTRKVGPSDTVQSWGPLIQHQKLAIKLRPELLKITKKAGLAV